MKTCKNCQTNDAIKYSKYSSGEFCSLICARGYSTKSKRLEINKQVSEKLSGKYFQKEDVRKKRTEEWKNQVKNKTNDEILKADFSSLSFGRLRKRIILEQSGKCNKCGLETWLESPITLELEHINGDHNDNVRSNLEALCPNCHSLTLTWRGRNKSNNKRKISDEVLLNALINYNFNIRQALIFVGLAPKGGNYKRCNRLKKEYDELE